MNTYYIKSDFFDIDIIKPILNKRGNWRLYNKNNDKNKVDFMYIDGKATYGEETSWDIKTKIKNILGYSKYNIAKKSLLYKNFKNKYPKIADKYMMRQYEINLRKLDPLKYKKLFTKNKIWIIKPVHGWKGAFIRVVDTYDKFKDYILKMQKKYISNKHALEWVLAEYINNPLLITNKKFHIRMHLLVYFKDKKVSAYVFNRGTIFRAEKDYKLEDFSNKDIHDTHFIEGYDLSFPKDFPNNKSKYIFEQVKDALGYIVSLFDPECYPESEICFETFGFDVMVLDNYKIKIIEVNTKIGLMATGLDKDYVKEYFNNILEIAVDDIFPPKNKIKKYREYSKINVINQNKIGGKSNTPTFSIHTELINRDVMKRLLIERGMIDAPKNTEYVDFLFIDGKFFYSARYLWALRTGVKNMLTDEKYEITDKTKLYQNMKKKYPKIADKYMMKSININITEKIDELKKIFIDNKIWNIKPQTGWYGIGQKLWMIKPAMGWHGIGQKVVDNYEECMQHIKKLPDILKENKYSRYITKKDWIVLEKYIDNPLLITKKKFHIRFHALFYNRNNIMRGFVFKNGHIIRAKKEFKLSDFGNKDIHDTHYIEGDELIFPDDFIKYFGKNNTDIVYLQLLDVIHYVLKLFTPNCYEETKYCYQVMGVDIMIKDNFDIVLLELENKMGWGVSKDKDRLMEEYCRNIVEIVADDIYPPPSNVKLLKNYTEITHKTDYMKGGKQKMNTYSLYIDDIDENIAEKLLQERGNWREAELGDEYVDFMYLDGTAFTFPKKGLWKTKTGVKNMVGDQKYVITDKSKFYSTMKKTYPDITKKYMMESHILDLNNVDINKYKHLFKKGKFWLLKPVMGFQGKGIKILKNFNEFKDHIYYLKRVWFGDLETTKFIKNKNMFVLDEYINNPLLVDKKKFHIRFHLLFSNINGKYKGYLFKNGHILRAKEKYILDFFDNKDIHDTHHIDDYELIFPNDFPKKNKADYVFNQVADVLHYVFKLLKSNCYPESKNCYQVFGIDVMVLDDYSIKILECNNKQAWVGGNVKWLMERYFNNILETTVDKLYPPSNKIEKKHNYVNITNKN